MAIESISLSISRRVWDGAGINLATSRSAVGLTTNCAIKPGENAKFCETVQCACAKVLINVRVFLLFFVVDYFDIWLRHEVIHQKLYEEYIIHSTV